MQPSDIAEEEEEQFFILRPPSENEFDAQVKKKRLDFYSMSEASWLKKSSKRIPEFLLSQGE